MIDDVNTSNVFTNNFQSQPSI